MNLYSGRSFWIKWTYTLLHICFGSTPRKGKLSGKCAHGSQSLLKSYVTLFRNKTNYRALIFNHLNYIKLPKLWICLMVSFCTILSGSTNRLKPCTMFAYALTAYMKSICSTQNLNYSLNWIWLKFTYDSFLYFIFTLTYKIYPYLCWLTTLQKFFEGGWGNSFCGGMHSH